MSFFLFYRQSYGLVSRVPVEFSHNTCKFGNLYAHPPRRIPTVFRRSYHFHQSLFHAALPYGQTHNQMEIPRYPFDRHWKYRGLHPRQLTAAYSKRHWSVLPSHH